MRIGGIKSDPRKARSYREFLYILPFIILVGLFSYFPLYGWIYAFHDYQPPKPITAETFVGLKWFSYIISNPVRTADVLRVLRNTFAISGISLFFSWFPMIFAVFLNEIKCRPYQKFVQTVTTLPNFISWVLVFSVAFNVFGSNGAVNSVLLDLKLIDKPISFLKSKDHMWFKMWLWLTWKNAGWAAIMYLAAITGIDEQMIEAARVDGATRMHRALGDAGIPFDRKSFLPHITLVRKAQLRRGTKLGELPLPAAETRAARVSLMLSTRGKSGMIYTELGAVGAREGRA